MLLKAAPQDDLNWKIEGNPQIFEFDLGLSAPYFPIEDELYFQSIGSALKHFTECVWPKYPESSVILYRGNADFSTHFQWSERQEENYRIWASSQAEHTKEHSLRLFCAETFISYFQMLAHKLPSEIDVRVVLDAPLSGSLAEHLHLLSPVRFEHFQIESSLQFFSSIGICFPTDSECNTSVLKILDAYIRRQVSFKPVYEPILIEQWEGLDEIHVIEEALSERGQRMLKGFEAAGGKVVKIRGRGI